MAHKWFCGFLSVLYLLTAIPFSSWHETRFDLGEFGSRVLVALFFGFAAWGDDD